MSLFYGFGTGILLCLTFGTVFFALMQNSVDNGYKSGLKIAFGVVVCDTLFVTSALFGTSYLPKIEGLENALTLVGVVFLTVMGLVNIFKGAPRLVYPQTRFGNFVYYFTTGFLLNGLNPINFFSWVTLAALLRTKFQYTVDEQIAFMGASLVAIFLTESLLAVSAHKLKRFFTPRVATIFNRTTGVVFLAIAVQLAWTRLYEPLVHWIGR